MKYRVTWTTASAAEAIAAGCSEIDVAAVFDAPAHSRLELRTGRLLAVWALGWHLVIDTDDAPVIQILHVRRMTDAELEHLHRETR